MKLASPTYSPCRPCSACCRMASSGAARKASSARATSASSACARRSVQCVCSLTALRLRAVRLHTHWTDRRAQALLALVALALLAFLAAPLLAILQQALQGRQGEYVGLANFIAYAQTPALLQSLWNSLWVSALVTMLTVPPAFGFAYALTRSCMPAKPLFRAITLIPLLAPSLLSAISLIYWFGNQGVLKGWLQ